MSGLQPYENRLDSMERHDLLREPFTLHSGQTPVVNKEGDELLCFASNNYLGLTDNEQVKQSARDAVDAFGTGSGAARLITGNMSVHEALERDIAAYKRTDSAIVFGSGYATNLGTIQALAGKGDAIYYDEYNHASLIDGIRLSGADHYAYEHADPDHLRECIEQAPDDVNRQFVITDGVFSMDGDLAPLPDIVEVCSETEALLMVDDAHGTGVIGEEGQGTVRHFGLTQEEVPIQMGTLSKALGAQGGFIAGSETLVQFLRNRARSFVYSTAPAPATMAAARKAIDVAREASKQRERVDQHITHLHGTLRDAGLRVLPEQPRTAIMGILVGDPEQALEFSDRLEEEELLIPAVRPPTVPRGMSRLRLTVMATHTEQQVHRAASTIVDVAEEVL